VAERLKVTRRADGDHRATIRVEFDIGIEDLARAIGYAIEFETCAATAERVPSEALPALTRADVLDAARTMHHEFGMVGVDTSAGENLNRRVITKDDLRRRATQLFPEFTQQQSSDQKRGKG
jgi:hypothetical protein